jgi:predicted aldo/keto reductase-like oxidoreductase
MRYRTFGRLDWQPSALGFGAMRLPRLDSDPSKIDEALATRMVRTAIDRGVNYVDTAWPYHSEQSERFLGRCLRDGYRERIRLATKMPSWLVETADDFDRFLDEQLHRLDTDSVDFYLLHGLNRVQWPKLRDLGVLEWAERATRDGRVGHLGFSFHDDLDTFRKIVDAFDWTLCQIQYNFMDVGFQAGREGLDYAAARGLAVIVMEPLRGGSLTRPAPREVATLWDSAPTRRSQAEWALQWVWSQAEVSLALSCPECRRWTTWRRTSRAPIARPSGCSARTSFASSTASATRTAPWPRFPARIAATASRVRRTWRSLASSNSTTTRPRTTTSNERASATRAS